MIHRKLYVRKRASRSPVRVNLLLFFAYGGLWLQPKANNYWDPKLLAEKQGSHG